MKILFKIVLFLIVFISYTLGSFAHQIGVLQINNLNSKDILSIKSNGNNLLPITCGDLNNIKSNNYPIIIISEYFGFTDENYNSIIKYLKSGGKIILTTPTNPTEDSTFAKLSKLVGVKIEKVQISQDKLDVNWVEKTLAGNKLKEFSRIAQVSLYPQTTHLAVFGDIERHESAISLNEKGSVFSWELSKVSEKKFTEKSLQFLLEELLPKSQFKQAFSPSLFNHNERDENFEKSRNYILNYQDNIINYSQDISLAQQNFELAEINKLYADYHKKNNDFKDYEKYMKKAEKLILSGIFSTNNLASAENRGIWFDRGTIVDIRNQNEMGKYFDKLQKSGINTVYFETVNAGYTIYPSAIGTQNPLTKGKDPLKWAVEEAHKRGLKLHAWMWIFAVGNDRHNKIIDKKDNYVGPVLEKNMRWALLGENGNFRPKNQPEFWIDPSHKEGKTYLLNLAKEIVKNYSVDGIQLDYIRYPFQRSDNLMGFNHNSTENFALKTGEKLSKDDYQTNFLWNKWKEDNINSFVKQISKETKELKPDLKISASVFSKSQQNRLSSIQQNWENWIKYSAIDSLTPMSYSTSLEALDTNLFYLRPQVGACPIYPGIALKHVDEIALMEQIAKIRTEGFPGISLFAVAQLDENKSYFMQNGIFSSKTFDVSYNPTQAGILILEDFKIMLQTIKKTNSDLNTKQKEELNKMLANTNSAIANAKNSQLNLAINTINLLETQTDSFFKSFSLYNPQREQTAKSYLKRASNLLKIATHGE